MIAGILLIIIIGIVVLGIIAWHNYTKEKQETERKIERLSGAHAFKMRILSHLFSMNKATDYKMSIMETLNIDIEMFKVCLDQLTNEKLATAQAHTLTLTAFGKKYAEIYAEQEVESMK